MIPPFRNPENDPIGMAMEPFDRDHLLLMVNTQNNPFNKVVLVFAVLVSEMKQLAQTVLHSL